MLTAASPFHMECAVLSPGFLTASEYHQDSLGILSCHHFQGAAQPSRLLLLAPRGCVPGQDRLLGAELAHLLVHRRHHLEVGVAHTVHLLQGGRGNGKSRPDDSAKLAINAPPLGKTPIQPANNPTQSSARTRRTTLQSPDRRHVKHAQAPPGCAQPHGPQGSPACDR